MRPMSHMVTKTVLQQSARDTILHPLNPINPLDSYKATRQSAKVGCSNKTTRATTGVNMPDFPRADLLEINRPTL